MRRRASLANGNLSARERRREQLRMLEALAAAATASGGNGVSLASSLHTLLSLDDLDDLDVESGDLDLTLVQPYLLCVQSVAATTAAALASVAAPHVLPADGRSGLRALLAAAAVAILALKSPLTLTKDALGRGEKLVFTALRAAPALCLGALVAESLLHTHGCGSPQRSDEPRAADLPRVAAEGLCALILIVVAAIRTIKPQLSRAAGERLVKLAFGTVVAAGALPRALDVESAPLSRPLDPLRGATRVLRAFCFASVFAAMLLATAPRKLARSSTAGLVATAASASVWALLVPSPMLFLAPLQVVAATYARVRVEGGLPGTTAPGSPRSKAGVICATLSDGGSDVALLESAKSAEEDADVREAMKKLTNGVSKERRDAISRILSR